MEYIINLSGEGKKWIAKASKVGDVNEQEFSARTPERVLRLVGKDIIKELEPEIIESVDRTEVVEDKQE
jgi:hypothetical protein